MNDDSKENQDNDYKETIWPICRITTERFDTMFGRIWAWFLILLELNDISIIETSNIEKSGACLWSRAQHFLYLKRKETISFPMLHEQSLY